MYQNSVIAAGLLTLAPLVYTYLLPILVRAVKLSRIPLVGKKPGEWFDTKARERISQNYCKTVEDGIKLVEKPFSEQC